MKYLTGLLLVLAAAALGAQTSYTVVQATGKVEIKTGNDWEALSTGDAVPETAMIATGFASTAVLESAGTSVTVQPLTRLTVSELQPDNAGTTLNLQTGRVRASVRSTRTGTTNFRVSSPVATAAVRGTEFGFNGYSVKVSEGTVALTPASGGRSVNVPQGTESEISEDGLPQSVDEARNAQSAVSFSAAPNSSVPASPATSGGGSAEPEKLIIIVE